MTSNGKTSKSNDALDFSRLYCTDRQPEFISVSSKNTFQSKMQPICQ